MLDGSQAGAVVNSKAVVYGSAGEVNVTKLQIADSDVTATAAELNILDGVTANKDELNYLDGVSQGVAVGEKAVVLNSTKDIAGLRNVTVMKEHYSRYRYSCRWCHNK